MYKAFGNPDKDQYTTIYKTPSELLKLFILEDRYNIKQAIENYNIRKDKGQSVELDLKLIRARTKTLMFEILNILKRHYSKNPEAVTELKRKVNGKESELFSAIEEINDILDDKKLTRIDQEYRDPTLPGEEDEALGL